MDRVGVAGEGIGNWKGGKTSLQDLIRKSRYAQDYRYFVFKRDGWKSVISGYNGRLAHHHLISFSTLIDGHGIRKENWINFKHILFDLNNAITLTDREHKKFHSKYGKVTTPEQFEEFRRCFAN